MSSQVKKEPYGVGGWLTLFCFALLLTGLISVLGAMVAFKDKTEGGTIGGCIGIAVGLFTIGVFTALCLHLRAAVKLAYSFLAVQALFWLIAAMLGESPKYFAGVLTACIAWALYFHRSRRVHNTFFPSAAPAAEPAASEYRPFADVQ